MGERKFQFSRIFLIITTGIAFSLVAVYCWGLQTMAWWKFREYSKSTPILMLTPGTSQSVLPNPAEGIKLSHAGFEFEVPWTDLDVGKSKSMQNIAVYTFQSGRVISFYGPSPTHEDLLSEVEKDFGDKNGTLRTLFGGEATKSNYDFHRTMLEQTPDELRPWMNRREAYRLSMLLMIKGISSVGGETGLFNVRAHGWKGFQFDDPTKKPKKLTLELYDSNDQHVEIIFVPGKQEGSGISQADVNRALETLKPSDQLPAAETLPQEKSNLN